MHSFYVDPKLGGSDGTTMMGGTLYVEGDQFKPNTFDQIVIDVARGGVKVTLNGEVAQFEPGEITKIIVQAKGGFNTINVYNTLATAPVTIDIGSDDDDVILGNDGNGIDGIQGEVNIVSVKGSGSASVLLNDNADRFGETETIKATSVTGQYFAPISFDQAHLQGLTIEPGINPNAITIMDTPNNSMKPTTLIGTGYGTNTVSVWHTTGSLEVDGQNGFAQVNIGQPSGRLLRHQRDQGLRVRSRHRRVGGERYRQLDHRPKRDAHDSK